MTDDSVGLKFTGQINVADTRYVSAGDTVSLQSADNSADNIRITSIEADESTEFMNVIALLPAKKFSLGESVVMEAVQMSGNYNCTVPITAVYQEDNKNYVLVSETENTVMGDQDIARKVEVTVLEKNDLYAALDPSTLEIDSEVIINTDRYVKQGTEYVRFKHYILIGGKKDIGEKNSNFRMGYNATLSFCDYCFSSSRNVLFK